MLWKITERYTLFLDFIAFLLSFQTFSWQSPVLPIPPLFPLTYTPCVHILELLLERKCCLLLCCYKLLLIHFQKWEERSTFVYNFPTNFINLKPYERTNVVIQRWERRGEMILESLEYLSKQNDAAETDAIWHFNNKVYQMFTNINARVSSQI